MWTEKLSLCHRPRVHRAATTGHTHDLGMLMTGEWDLAWELRMGMMRKGRGSRDVFFAAALEKC